MSARDRLLPLVLAHPLHRTMGVEDIETGDGEARLSVTVDGAMVNPAGMLHGGVLYTLCDMVCYVALLGELGDDENAATHDLHISVLRSARAQDRVVVRGRVLRRARNVAFMEAEAHCGEALLARASVTKSILRPRAG